MHIKRRRDPIVRARGWLWILAPCAFLSCAYEHRVPPLGQEARLEIGAIGIDPQPFEPDVGFSAANSGKALGALRGAGQAIAFGMQGGAQTADLFGFALFTALGLALAPIAAIREAAITPTTQAMDEAHQMLVSAIQATDWQERLNLAMTKAMTRRETISPLADPARMAVWVEGPWLVVGGHDATPTLTLRVQLANDETCYIDRRWRWNGRAGDFMSIAGDHGRAYVAAETVGMGDLAKAIVADLFTDLQPRIVVYPNKESFARGNPPLMAMQPADYPSMIASWDNLRNDGAPDLSCRAIRALGPPAPISAPAPMRPNEIANYRYRRGRRP
jgi:hypothetical protein